MPLIKTATRNKEGESKPTRYYSHKQESKVAKELGSKLTPNSGATPFSKGDLLDDRGWLFECKTQTKDKETFTLKKEWFEKNKQESLFMGKPYSAVIFNFGPDQENYYIIDENTFKEILQIQSEKVV